MAITENEVKEILERLEKAGWQPQLCDTPVPAYESVHAGNPMEPGQEPSDFIMMPKAFLSMCPEGMIKVQGNSMLDAGICDGDWVKMTIAQEPKDGDIVVVVIGSECTLKSYYEDDNGVRWLIPQNKAEEGKYRVIRLDDTLEKVYLCGVVKEILKALPRVSTRSLRSTLNALKAYADEEPKITEQRVNEVIRIVAADIKIGRQWYAVCRSMMDEQIVADNEYDVFCKRVRKVVPNHEHLPRPDEMQAMAVESFSKPVSKWDEKKAPVKGKRYKAYKDLAERTTKLLTMSDEDFRRR